jgi:replication factor C large subunit
MHCQTCQEARSISWDVDLTPEDFLSWVDDNIPRMLKEPADLARIYGSISRADVYLRRTKKRQIYRMWKYVNFMSTAGVALQREGELKLSESHFPTPISMYSRTKGSRAVRDNLARKVATRCHTSRRVARKHFLPYLSAIFDKDRKSADRITMELELTDAERDSLTKLS